MATVFDHLPPAIAALIPELLDGWEGEGRADCGACPQIALAGPLAFVAETRCCTAHPPLANFLVGRALKTLPARGLIVARLKDPEGVTPESIDAPPAFAARYRAEKAHAFGRDPTLRCPFWAGGEHTCGVWRDRSAYCRGWFCRHDGGLDDGVAWKRASEHVVSLEATVASILVGRAFVARVPIPRTGADVDTWCAWYGWCADESERLGPDDLTVVADDLRKRAASEARRGAPLIQLQRGRDRGGPLPEVLAVAVSALTTVGDDVLVAGYSPFDVVRAPRAVFAFLSLLDGKAPWRTALAAARAETGEPRLDEALVRELRRVGALTATPAPPPGPSRTYLT